MKCSHCNDTGKIILLTSIVDCDCQSTGTSSYVLCGIKDRNLAVAVSPPLTNVEDLASWFKSKGIVAFSIDYGRPRNGVLVFQVRWQFKDGAYGDGSIVSDFSAENLVLDMIHEALRKAN